MQLRPYHRDKVRNCRGCSESKLIHAHGRCYSCYKREYDRQGRRADGKR